MKALTATSEMIIKYQGLTDYQTTWQRMRTFTEQRTSQTVDELWVLEHHPVFTQGQAGQPEHVLNPQNIPVIATDRGGQVTYHGPGQLIIYLLIDIKRRALSIRPLVSCIEQAVIQLLARYHIKGNTKPKAPGVYVDEAKVCALGLRVKRGCTYHGLALNVDMDLKPFNQINPCGFKGLAVTQLKSLGAPTKLSVVGPHLVDYLTQQLGAVGNSQD